MQPLKSGFWFEKYDKLCAANNQGAIGRVFGKESITIKLKLQITKLYVSPDGILALSSIFPSNFSCHLTTFVKPPVELRV